jgi:transmembrane protein DUF3566
MEGKMRKIKKIDPLSFMRISAICYALLGLVEGAFFSAMFSSIPFGSVPNMPRFLGPIFGGMAIVFFPILFGVIGAIFGALGAVIYNVSARFVGGIEVEVE